MQERESKASRGWRCHFAREVTGHVRVRPGEEAAGFEPQLCQGLHVCSLCLRSLDYEMEVITVAS